MAKKGGLGKGLGSLMVDNSIEDKDAVRNVKLHDVEPNREQPRKNFDQTALAELADSITEHGIMQPLLVRQLANGRYQIIAGERRWRASNMAGLSEVPVIVKDVSDTELMELALIENLQREDLNPVEEAKGYQVLMETHGLTQEEVAKQVGKSRPAVANAVRLLALPESVLQMVYDNKLSAGHAKTLLAFQNKDELLKAANTVAAQGISVRELEKMAKRSSMPHQIHFDTPKVRESFYTEVELALSEQLGRKVKVYEGKGKGIIELEFYSKEDLKDLANKIGRE